MYFVALYEKAVYDSRLARAFGPSPGVAVGAGNAWDCWADDVIAMMTKWARRLPPSAVERCPNFVALGNDGIDWHGQGPAVAVERRCSGPEGRCHVSGVDGTVAFPVAASELTELAAGSSLDVWDGATSILTCGGNSHRG